MEGCGRHNWRVALYERAKKAVASNLRRRRADMHLTQEDLAGRTDLDVRHLQKIEAGEVNLTLKTLAALAKGLRVSLRDLFK
jgi:transcriptional regulator with XRE-family HTH domain